MCSATAARSCCATPGHTPGHRSLLVKLPQMGNVVLSGDAVHFRENYETDGVPAFNFDRAQTVASIERDQEDRRQISKRPLSFSTMRATSTSCRRFRRRRNNRGGGTVTAGRAFG